MPQSCNVLLGDMFRKLGVEVRYSHEADNDDTIIAHAYAKQACILSGDHDMFRYDYDGPRISVFEDFQIKNGKLILLTHQNPTSTASRRPIISPPPQTKSKMHDWTYSRVYLRGSPSPLTRNLGNLHLMLRPLRQAVYHQFQISVKETFPVWNGTGVSWDESMVAPDPTLLELLSKNPLEVVKHFFTSLTRPDDFTVDDWHNHLWAVHAVVFEILVQSAEQKYTLYDLMSEYFKPTEEILRVSTVLVWI
jgi:hypothetical protein